MGTLAGYLEKNPVHKSPETPHPAPSSGHLVSLGTPTFICSVYVTMGGAASVLPLLGHGDRLCHSPVRQATAQGDRIPVALKHALEEEENALSDEPKAELTECGTMEQYAPWEENPENMLASSAARDGDRVSSWLCWIAVSRQA